jgi:glycosyltransferase involved in cell wall biosynthesis
MRATRRRIGVPGRRHLGWLGRLPVRTALRGYVRVRTRGWTEGSHLFVVGDSLGWSIDEDAHSLEATARRLGLAVADRRWARFADRQAVFFPSHFTALDPRWARTTHQLGLAYFHGRPGTAGYPEFDLAYERLRSDPGRVARVQVTHAEMYDLVVAAGVDPARVAVIRIGVDLDRFHPVDAESRRLAREALEIPAGSFVVGSFQKDGVGLAAGDEPKLVKGPDVLLAALELVHASNPDLFVLLTGLARGYVRAGLERLGIPHTHVLLPSLDGLPAAYQALDAYVVPSRQEGGPKGPLEAMASGIPVVSTRVGQTQEIMEDGRNGLLAGVEDAAGLAGGLLRLADDEQLRTALAAEGRRTAVAFATERLVPEWSALLDGFVHDPAPSLAGVRRPSPSPLLRFEIQRRRRVVFTAAALFLILWLFVTLPEELGDKPYDPNAVVRIVERDTGL